MRAPSQTSIIRLEPISLDVKMAASFLGTSVRQIRTLILTGELTPFYLGSGKPGGRNKQLLRVADLRAFIDKKAATASRATILTSPRNPS